MNIQPNAVSPEITAKQYKSGSFLRRLIRYAGVTLKQRREYRKAAPLADQRAFDWNWKAINYNRIALVNLLVSKFNQTSYLEIGCASNTLFDSVPANRKVGVDPASGGNVRATSDDFFATNTANFDVVFVDGLHTYEQVRLDIINALRFVNTPGWIALHDMLPRNWVEDHIPVVTKGAWTGDVWKVAFELMQTPGIEFKILKIDHGVGVIKVLERDVKLHDLRAELTAKRFSYFFDNFTKLPVVEWAEAQDWLKA